jgi:hypothetical protein
MKRGLFAVAIAMTAAGVASALAFAPIAQSPLRPVQVASRPPPDPGSLAGTAKSTLKSRQPPVPVLIKARAPIELPTVASDGAVPESAAKATEEAGAKATEEAGEGSAKAAIEADGYKSVRLVRKGANGLWYAEALRGRTKVLLTVDSQGNVAAE